MGDPGRSTGRRTFVVLSVLLPLAIVAGLVWLVVGGNGERGGGGGDTASSSAPPGSGASERSEPPSATEDDARPEEGAPADPGPDPTDDKTSRTLRGKTVVIDPGHNPGNREHATAINRSVDIGTGHKECDTTGTASNSGYPEAQFTLEVSRKARAILEQRGATVKFTQDDDRPYGPCVDERARIGNRAKADAVVSVHADGSAPGNRGFHVILPGAVRGGAADTGPIVEESARLGGRLADSYRSATGMRPSNYLGSDVASSGLTTREDLGGLNLSKVPKVFLECGNMRDDGDVALLTDDRWQGKAARGIADGITAYLVGNR